MLCNNFLSCDSCVRANCIFAKVSHQDDPLCVRSYGSLQNMNLKFLSSNLVGCRRPGTTTSPTPEITVWTLGEILAITFGLTIILLMVGGIGFCIWKNKSGTSCVRPVEHQVEVELDLKKVELERLDIKLIAEER